MGQYFMARVGSGQLFMVWVSIWKISPKNIKFFNLFSSSQKNLFGLFLIYCGSKVSSGWVGSGPISSHAREIRVIISLISLVAC